MAERAAIILPLLRQVPDFLRQSLRSALDQTVPAEVVVVTSAATPAAERAVLAAAANGPGGERLRIVERSQPGFAAALNLGFASTSATRLGLLLSDDWLEPTAVEASLALDADIVSGGKTLWKADGVTPLGVNGLRTEERYRRLTNDHDRANHLTHFLLLRRGPLEAVGGVDETLGDLAGVDDFDLLWCLLERGASVAFVGHSLYHVRDHPGERLTLRSADAALVSLGRILAKHGVPPEDRPALLAAHGRWYGRTMEDVIGSDA
jgi:glycosyltransferase involved in cell wall biosynthesis